MLRNDGRAKGELRKITITPGFQLYAEGSALIEVGLTKVLCAVSVEDRVPAFLQGSGKGWITAEYSMLPRATASRTQREGTGGRFSGRTYEIQRLIGRSLRAVVDLRALGERTCRVDCDVLQADGGTRTAAVTGSYVALYQAMRKLVQLRAIPSNPIKGAVAGISAGIVNGEQLLDLTYEEDFRADVDFNVVMTDQGELVEIQGTGEGKPFSVDTVHSLLALAREGLGTILEVQKAAVANLQIR